MTGGLLERDNLARAVQAEEVIVVFMDEDQRKIFRESSGAIIVSSIENIYTLDNYYFVSVCVLDSQGEAVPICQAISANDYNTTAKIVLETMKLLEPSSVCKVHCLMSPGALEEAFIHALSQTLTPNSELLTYPLQPAWVETYDYIIQSSLKPVVTRLDQLIYAVFKMNEFLQCRRERYLCGFYGKNRSKVQKAFTSLHEMYEQRDSIRFEIVEATTRDVRELDSDISSKPDDERPAWEISKFDGGVLIESNVISALRKGKLFCMDKNCQVYCDICIKDSTIQNISYMEGIPCAHSLSCDCTDYSKTYNCIHLHLVTKHILSHKTLFQRNSLTSVYESKDGVIAGKSDHNYVHEQNTGIGKSNPTDTVTSQEDQDTIDSIRPCLVKLQKLENIDLNKALSTPFQKKSDYGAEESELLMEAINKLTSAARYLKTFKERQGDTETKKNKEKNGLRKSGRKRKRPFLKNMCLDVIEFIDSNFPGNAKDIKLPSNKKQVNEEFTTPKNASSQNENNEPCNSTSTETPTKLVTDNFDDTKNLINNRTKNYPHQVIGANIPRHNLLRAALYANVNDINWCALVCGHQDKNLEMLANLEEFDIDEREVILEKCILAKSLWRCKKCKDSSSIESMLSGFIICKLCQHWFHRICCSDKKHQLDQNSEHLTEDYVCERCMSLFFGHNPEDQVQVEANVSNQDSLQLQTVSVDAAIPINEVTEKNYIVENMDTASKLNQGEEHIEFMQTQKASGQSQELTEEQISSGTQIYYQLPPNVTFPTTGEGHYVVQLQGNTVQQIGFEVI